MNVIVIVIDTLRQDHVGVYHQGRATFEKIAPCATPNLDALAARSIVFDNAYPEALPTMPIRCQLMTGQRTLPFRFWQPLLPSDISIADILSREGYTCGLISDTYHYRAPGQNYHRSFHAYRWIRGQEYDPYESAPTRRNVDDYVNEHYNAHWRRIVSQMLANTDEFQDEEDWFPAQVVDEAIGWLRKNRVHDKIFLWIDSFDPHEPWDPPPRFDTYTDPNYRGPRLMMPMGGQAETWATPEQIEHIRGLYAGETAFVDYCLGRLFEALDDLGYMEDSLILLLGDHGHPLADHGKFLKGTDRMYSELLKVPFLVHLPGDKNKGHRTGALVQFQDVLPTILDLIGLGNNDSAFHGSSFRPVVMGDANDHRESIVTGYHEGIDRCVRDREWSLILRPDDEPDELYHLPSDPTEQRNLVDERADVAKQMGGRFGQYFFRRQRSPAIKGIQGKYELASGTVE